MRASAQKPFPNIGPLSYLARCVEAVHSRHVGAYAVDARVVVCVQRGTDVSRGGLGGAREGVERSGLAAVRFAADVVRPVPVELYGMVWVCWNVGLYIYDSDQQHQGLGNNPHSETEPINRNLDLDDVNRAMKRGMHAY